MNKLKKILLAGLLGLVIVASPASSVIINAEESQTVKDERTVAKVELNSYYNDLIRGYDINDYIYEAMEKCYNKGIDVLGSCDECTISSYLTEYKTKLASYVQNLTKRVSENLLLLSDSTTISSGKYGDTVNVPLYLMNMGSTTIYDIVVTPVVSSDRSKWPFEIVTPDDSQYLNGLFSAQSMTEAESNQGGLVWTFKVRDDVMQGTYPLTFDVFYTTNGSSVSTTVTTYFNATAKNPSDKLIADTDELDSNPRIIVTGFTTEPETVYAGDTFTLNIDLQNTSSETTVKNVLFDLEAIVSSSTNTADSYAVFLPTSGSNSVYTDEITPGETYHLSIEMTAKSDLSQKPYALTVNMKYDTDENLNITDSSDVSIPVKQEAKVETGTEEVLPASINVGEDSNIMFDVYNTGKTTLYNVKVTFEGDSINSGLTYLGNINAGETKSVDTNVTGVAADNGEGTIKAIISYEDENGNVSSIEKDLSLSVTEMSYDYSDYDYSYDDTSYDDTSSGGGVPVVLIVIIVIVVVVVAAVIIILKVKNAKKKKAELDALKDDEDDEL